MFVLNEITINKHITMLFLRVMKKKRAKVMIESTFFMCVLKIFDSQP